jgi:hypothetical protein
MRWCRIENEAGQAAVVAEVSLVVHEPRGWKRTSEFATSPEDVDPYQYEPAQPAKPTEPAAKVAKTNTKEKP